jgi:hypothetical protein
VKGPTGLKYALRSSALPSLAAQRSERLLYWTRTISALISDDSRDENQLEGIVAAEAAGLKLRADLIASLRNGNYQSREESAPSETITA